MRPAGCARWRYRPGVMREPVGRLPQFGRSVPVEELRMAAGAAGRRGTRQKPMGGWVEPGEQGAPNGAPCGSAGEGEVLERHEVREIRPEFGSRCSVRRRQCDWPGATSVHCQPAASPSEVGCPSPMARECGRRCAPPLTVPKNGPTGPATANERMALALLPSLGDQEHRRALEWHSLTVGSAASAAKSAATRVRPQRSSPKLR
jgi:hypothetical protein